METEKAAAETEQAVAEARPVDVQVETKPAPKAKRAARAKKTAPKTKAKRGLCESAKKDPVAWERKLAAFRAHRVAEKKAIEAGFKHKPGKGYHHALHLFCDKHGISYASTAKKGKRS